MTETQLILLLFVLTVIRVFMHWRTNWPANETVRRQTRETIDSVVWAGVVALLLIHFVVRSFYIPSGSMLETLQINDYILVNEVVYRIGHPARGEIAVFHPPQETYAGDKNDLIKRIVAIEGDEIAVRDGVLYLNGAPTLEPYIAEQPLNDFPPTRIRPGHVFMMGDNRNDSMDSRVFGQVPMENLVGRAEWIFFPLGRFGRLHHSPPKPLMNERS